MAADQQVNTQVVLTADTSQYQQQMLAAQQSTAASQTGIDRLLASLDRIGKNTGRGLLVLAAGTSATLTAAGLAAAKFDDQLSSLKANSAITGRSMQGMTNQINRLRQDLPLATESVISLVESLQKMGVSPTDMEKTVRTFVKMGAATGENVGSLASGMIQLQTQLGVLPKATERYADVLTGLSANMGVSAQSTLDFANSIAPVARTVGVTQKELLGFSAAFAKSGQDGLAASTVMTQLMMSISKASRYGTQDLKMFAEVADTTVEQFQKMSSADQIMKIFTEINKAGPDAVKILDQMGFEGARSARAIQGVIQAGELPKAMREAGLSEGSLEKGAAAAMGGLADSTQRLQNAMAALATEVGGPLSGALSGTINLGTALTNTLTGLLGPISGLITGIGQIAGPVMTGLGLGVSNIGTMVGAAALYSMLRGPVVAGLLRGSGRVGPESRFWGRSIRSMEEGRGGRIQTPLYTGAAWLGRNVAGEEARERARVLREQGARWMTPMRGRWDALTGQVRTALASDDPRVVAARERYDTARARVEGSRGYQEYTRGREQLAASRTQLGERWGAFRGEGPRAGLGMRALMAGAITSSNIAAFSRFGLTSLYAGEDITNRRLTNRPEAPPTWRESREAQPGSRIGAARHWFDSRISTPTPTLQPGSAASLLTGRVGSEQLAFRHVMREVTGGLRGFATELGRTAVGLTRMGSGLAGMAAGGIGRRLGAGLGGLASMMGGPMGVAMLAGVGAISAVSSERARIRDQEEALKNSSTMTSAYNEYAAALGMAARSATEFADVLGSVGENIAQGTIGTGRRVSAGLTATARAPGYQLTNTALQRMDERQATAYMESVYSYGGAPEEVTRAATADLIKKFGPDVAQRIITNAQAGGTEATSLFSGGWRPQNLYSLTSAQSTSVTERVLPAMRSQLQQASDLYGADSTQSRQVAAAQIKDLAEMISSSSQFAPGQRKALVGVIAEYLGTTEQELGISDLERGAIGRADTGREALRRLLSSTKEGRPRDDLIRILETVDPELVKAAQERTYRSPEGRYGLEERDYTMPGLGMVTEQGLFTAPYRQSISRLLSTQVGSTTGAGVFLGQNQGVYGEYMASEGNLAAQYRATMALASDVKGAVSATGDRSLHAGVGESTTDAYYRDLAATSAALDRFKESLGSSSHELYGLATAAQGAIQSMMASSYGRMNTGQQVGADLVNLMQAYNADLSTEEGQAGLQRAQGQWEQRKDWFNSTIKSMYMAQESFEYGLTKQQESRARQRSYQMEDYTRQRRLGQENFDRQQMRGEIAYDRSRAYSLEDFNRQRDQGEEDYQRSRMYAEKDFAHQQVMMNRQAVTAMQDMYSRMTTQRTWDAQNLLVNIEDQARLMRAQQENLAAIRAQGVSGDVISFLGLNNFQAQGQVARLAADIANDPNLVGQLNQAMAGRLDLAEMFVFDPDNEQWKEMQRAFNQQNERSDEAMERSMGRMADNFQRSMDRMDQAHKESLRYQFEDYERYLAQSEEEFNRSISRNETEFQISIDNSREAMARQFKLYNTDFETMYKTALSTMDAGTKAQFEIFRGVLDLEWSEIKDSATMISTEFPKILAPLFGGLGPLQRLINAGVFGHDVPRQYSDQYGPAGTSGTLYKQPGGAGGELPISDAEAYRRVLAAEEGSKGQSGSVIPGGTFAGGGHHPLLGSSYRVTSRFGMRVNPVTKRYELHNGTDLAAETGTPIKSYADGVVSFAGRDKYSGNVVQVEHGGGMRTRYHHMSRIGTEVGAHVAAGELIGYVGSTGNSTGPHLHFSVFNNGKAVDSLPYLGGTVISGGALAPMFVGGKSAPTKADVMRTIVSDQRVRRLEEAFSWGPLSNFMSQGRMSMALGAHWANRYNPGREDRSLEQTDWFARGSIFSSPRTIGVGENGPEAVIPLSERGATFMADVISKFAAAGADKLRTAGAATTTVQHITYYQQIDSGTHFHGKIEAVASDPAALVNQLEAKARLSRLARSHR